MYYFIQAWAILASLLTVVAGTTSTIASEPYSPSTLVHTDGSEVIAQESEPQPAATPESETPETPEPPTEPEPEATPEPPAPGLPAPATPTEPEPTPKPTETQTPTPSEPSAPVEPPTEETMPTEETESTELILDAQGELVDGDQLLESDNSLYDEYTFEGEEGQSVTVTLESSQFDTYLAIFTPDDKLLEEHDDVSQTDSNSEITVTLPTTGVYRVIVNSYDSKGRGTYNLKIR